MRVHSSNLRQGMVLVLPFIALYWANLAHHTLFFDELNAWGIAAASPNLRTLFRYVHFEGHPYLWYLILWVPSRLTHNFVLLKLVTGVFGTLILGVLACFAPFTPRQRVLVLASYFTLWEYTVMARMYGLLFLLALLYAWRKTLYPEKVKGNVILLGLIASTEVSGLLLSIALLLQYLWEGRPRKAEAWIVPLLLYGLLAGAAVYSFLPDPGISWHTSGKIGADLYHPYRLLRAAVNVSAAPWWPLAADYPHHFWRREREPYLALYVLSPLALLCLYRALAPYRDLQVMLGMTLLLAFAFAVTVYVGQVRHWGIVFIAFILALWFRAARQLQVHSNLYIDALLSVSVAAGVLAIIASWMHPFSGVAAAAAWVDVNAPGVPLISQFDTASAPLAETWERPVYFMECRCFDTFKLFSEARDYLPPEHYAEGIRHAMQDLKVDRLLFATEQPLSLSMLQSFNDRELASELMYSTVHNEVHDYFIYSIRALHAAQRTAAAAPHTRPVDKW